VVDAETRWEFARFFLNGLVATAVHFGVLTFAIEALRFPSAAVANFCAAVVGTIVSFLGNRHFVFRGHEGRLVGQAWRFVLLYVATLSLHAGVLYLWTDVYGLDYRIGFLIATAIQVMLSYLGNKLLVFAK
jgi:putative flippase GtrA